MKVVEKLKEQNKDEEIVDITDMEVGLQRLE